MKLIRFPYHIFLLPLFFILHNYTVHWLYLQPSDFFMLAAKYCLAAGLIFFIFYLFLKSRNKAALVTFFLLCINFFFPYIHDLTRKYLSFIAKYSFIIPFLFILFIFIFFKIRKTHHSFSRITKYLDILFLFLILLDISILVSRKINSSVKKLSIVNNDIPYTPCPDCPKPDIYFLLFDEYSSSASLKEDYNYDNGFLDTFLVQKGFRIQPQSISNYTITALSSASIMNMSYLHINDTMAVTSIDYSNASRLAGNSQSTAFLEKMGYDIVNVSIFDMKGKKAPMKIFFSLNVSETITAQTFLARMYHEIGWNFFRKRIFDNGAKKSTSGFQNIHAGIDRIKKLSVTRSRVPRLIYGHLLLPHPPFMMNKKGPLSTAQIATTPYSSVNAYLDYVYYTNTVIQDIVTTIQTNTNGNAAIIIMSDHGFRRPLSALFPVQHFKIQNAVYFPDKNYSLLYDSISGVNQFRVILNTLFRQNIPLLDDKKHYLKDRK